MSPLTQRALEPTKAAFNTMQWEQDVESAAAPEGKEKGGKAGQRRGVLNFFFFFFFFLFVRRRRNLFFSLLHLNSLRTRHSSV